MEREEVRVFQREQCYKATSKTVNKRIKCVITLGMRQAVFRVLHAD